MNRGPNTFTARTDSVTSITRLVRVPVDNISVTIHSPIRPDANVSQLLSLIPTRTFALRNWPKIVVHLFNLWRLIVKQVNWNATANRTELLNNISGRLMANVINILHKDRVSRLYSSALMNRLPFRPVSLQLPVAVSEFKIRLVGREIFIILPTDFSPAVEFKTREIRTEKQKKKKKIFKLPIGLDTLFSINYYFYIHFATIYNRSSWNWNKSTKKK